MADEDENPPGEDENPPGEDENEDGEENEDEDGEDGGDGEGEGKGKKNPDLERAIKRRDRAITRTRELEAELASLRAKDKEGEEPDPVAQANDRLVRSEVRTQLAALGVTDKKDQAAILDVINLDGIEVDKNGEVDEDEVEERLGELRRIFGGKAERRVPRTTSPRDKGGNGKTKSDPDRERYERILRR